MNKNLVQTASNVKPLQLTKTHNREVEGMSKKKNGSQILAFAYDKTNLPDKQKKAFKLRLCGKTLIYAENPTGGDPLLVSAMRCGLRLCPSCSWIRARKVFQNVYSIIMEPEFSGKQFIFLSLTVKNCRGEKLESEIKRLLLAWQKLTRDTRHEGFTKSFLGTFRALEVTYKKLKGYHPHLHAMAAVEPAYFRKSNKHYISQSKLRELWKDACGLDYLPQCRIQRVKGTKSKQIAEVAKYTVKSASYINRPEVIEILDKALFRKRLIAYGGLFKTVRNRLDLPDEELSDDLPHLTVEEILRNPYIKKIVYEWNLGSYHILEVPPSTDPADWLDPGRLAAEVLKRQAASWGQGV